VASKLTWLTCKDSPGASPRKEAIGLLTAVTDLFQRDGAPFEQVVIAEHICANAFVSERETCVRLYLAASRVRNVASR